MSLKKTVIAVQLYTLRNFTKTPKDIIETLKKVKKIGYDIVQVSGMGPIAPEELKKILDGEGLKICVTHTPFERILNETEKVIYEHNLWECSYVAPGVAPEKYRNKDGYFQFAKDAEEVGKKLSKYGIHLAYHNHSFELERYNTMTGLDIIYENTDLEYLKAEIDTYWIQHGGADPAEWILKLKGRVPLVHLKDMTIKDNKQIMAEVGEGNLNWKNILSACKKSGVEWYIVEQDECYRDPFESLKISLENLHKMGIK